MRRVSDASALSSTIQYWNRNGKKRKEQSTAVRSEVSEQQPDARIVVAPASVEDAELEENIVVFRLVNTGEESTSSCQPGYEAFDPFDPDPDLLCKSSLFRDYVTATDFELILDAVNALMNRFRKYSKVSLFMLVFLSFAALIVSIFAQVYAGVTIQLFLFAAVGGLQTIFRRRCENTVNGMLNTEVNPSLNQNRSVSIQLTQSEAGCCKRYFQLDICLHPATAPLTTEMIRAHQNPLQRGGAVEQWKSEVAVVQPAVPADSVVRTDLGSSHSCGSSTMSSRARDPRKETRGTS